MKLITFVFVFSVLIACSLAIVCPERYCEVMSCDGKPKTQEDCDKMHKMTPDTKYILTVKASLCGCCNKCLRIIKEGDACTLVTRFVADSRCADGLKCSDSGKCVKA